MGRLLDLVSAPNGAIEGERVAVSAIGLPANDPIKPTPADERIEKMVAKLEADPDLRYAMETHTDVNSDEVILTVAIKGKAACELRIPKSRYDALALLEMIAQHTARETLQ